MPRQGKIARLPLALRTEPNQRLADNQNGASLLDWLNASPAVQAILARDFGGEPVTKQNLYEWRNGGFIESQTRQEILEQAGDMASDAAECDPAGCGNLIGHLVALLAVRYAALLARWDRDDNEALRVQLRVLHTFTRDLAALHRINQFAERQKSDQARPDRKEKQRDKSETLARQPSAVSLRADDEHLAQRRREAEAVPMTVPAAVAASPEYAAHRMATNPSVTVNTGSPALDQNLAKSCATGVQPMAPRPGFGSNQVKPMPGRGSTKIKIEPVTILADDRPPAAASVLAPHPRAPLSRGSTTASPLDKVVPVLISPEDAVDQFVAANTWTPETGLLPAALRRAIFDALYTPK
jgi:hypothetical protein